MYMLDLDSLPAEILKHFHTSDNSIRWQDKIAGTEVLQKARMLSTQRRMRKERLPKQTLYGDLP